MLEDLEYTITEDAEGNTLSGEKNYRFRLSHDLPSNDYWSVVVYDSEINLIIKTDQSWPSVFSTRNGLSVNQDGSVDIWFGPKAPAGHGNNWIQTIPGKGWTMMLRLYGTLESGNGHSWRPGELEVTQKIII